MDVFIDIETLPTESNQQIDYVVANIKAPGNYKKPEAIEKYINAERENVVRGTALSGLFGRVYMIGIAIGDGPVNVLRGETGEKPVLEQLQKALQEADLYDEYRFKGKLIGHNLLDFDLPFLLQRFMVNGIKPIINPMDKPNAADTMKLFACGRYKQYYKLEALCMAFGIESPKSGLDGSKVYDSYLAGNHDEVADYCAQDVEATRKLYRAMTDIKVAA